jgi:hypothetical protein
MSMPALMAWYRNAECIASRTTVVAAERERQVLTPPLMMRTPGQARLMSARGLDEVLRVVVVLLDARRDGEDVGIEDDVLGREADLAR